METNEIQLLVYASTVIGLLLGVFVLFVFVFYKLRQKKYLERIAQTEKALLHAKLETQEQTIKWIGQELHDNVGQLLILAKLNLSSYTDDPKLLAIRNIVSKSIEDIRMLSKSFNPQRLNTQGLCATITEDLKLLENSGHFTTEIKLAGNEIRLSSDSDVIVYRIFQELMANAIKHAQASSFQVRLVYTEQDFSMTVTDNGIGFNGTKIQENQGLPGLRQRATLIGAELYISSVEGEGTLTTLRLPLLTK